MSVLRFSMKLKRIMFLLAVCAVSPASLTASKEIEGRRPLEHEDYDRWKTITQRAISPDGEWILYSIQSGKIDAEATLIVREIGSKREYAIPRGNGARFTRDSRFLICKVTPKTDSKDESDADSESQDKVVSQLQILELDSGSSVAFDRVSSFKLAKESGKWLVYQLADAEDSKALLGSESTINEVYEVTSAGLQRPVQQRQLKKREALKAGYRESQEETPKEESEAKNQNENETNKAEQAKTKRIEEKLKEKKNGSTLVLRNLATGIERRFPFVDDYEISKFGDALAFATSVKAVDNEETTPDEDKTSNDGDKNHDESKSQEHVDGVFVVNLRTSEWKKVIDGIGEYKGLSWNDQGTLLSFLTNKNDFGSETSAWDVYLWRSQQEVAQVIASEGSDGLPDGWWVSDSANLTFTEDGRRLYFGTAPIPEDVLKQRKEADSDSDSNTVDDKDPKAKLDVWHWQDPLLQPQQLVRLEAERKRSYRALFDIEAKKILQLATREVADIWIDPRSPSHVVLANSDFRYRRQLSWNYPGRRDTFLIDLRTGARRIVRENAVSDARISPDGKYIVWWDGASKWFGLSTETEAEPIEISRGISQPLFDELHDRPMPPSPYGVAGWSTDDRYVFIYDRYDIWKLDPNGAESPVCVTENLGRKRTIRFRYIRLDEDSRAIDLTKPMILSAFNESTKATGYFRLNLGEGADEATSESEQPTKLTQLIYLDESIGGLARAKDSDAILFSRRSFERCGDLWASTLDFQRIRRISDINPQQSEYTWGSAELVHWQATDGQALDGILIKPDGFDASQKYPLLVYFYERSSDRLHNYYTPSASRSVINFSFYVSRGYVLFVPDIPYKTGEPGPSAVNSVVSGVQHVVDQGFVDEERIGIQGHSWGGYQTAYLVTQTNMFACAESGAPVSNMTSAYGGIRWASGLSRMFQYERTQSRIGDTLWAAREKYIANSPLFFVDKIETPLLILHNDDDGAVPWYQGIELFVAMRRLEKPAWLLNYNGDPHWVMKEENRRDFSIRMQQFFDHYLMDAPEPEWMAVGVPAVDKGKKFGLELLEPKEEPTEGGK